MGKRSGGRTKRLHKKLRTGPFQQLGFELRFNVPEPEAEAFLDELIDLVEERGLLFGGGSSGGYVVPNGRASATEAHRDIFQRWLAAKPHVSAVHVGPLEDAWHEPAGR
jgi:uncharacterized protein YggL (DUF469 family)